jgi:hypothetical protein
MDRERDRFDFYACGSVRARVRIIANGEFRLFRRKFGGRFDAAGKAA